MNKARQTNSPGQFSVDSVHSLPAAAVGQLLKVDLTAGLLPQDVATRQVDYGLNTIPRHEGFSVWYRLWQELTNPLILILIFAFGLTLYLGELVDATVVALAIIINISIALYQEGKAKNIFATLHKKQAKTARVLRDHEELLVSAENLVPGDIVYVSSGEAIPADLRIIDSDNAEADESSLTGEWEPVEKSPKPVKQAAAVAERESMLFAGTLLAGGSVVGIVTNTGSNTEFGQLAASTSTETELTPLQQQLKKMAYILSVIVIVLSVVIVVIGLLRGLPYADVTLIAIAIAVSAVPEGLPSAITAILAVGMRHVLEQDGLVKSLLAAETLGTTDVIITDKTGTLTEGRMSLVSLLPAFSTDVATTDELSDLDVHQSVLLRSALLCSDGFVTTGDQGQLVANGRPVEKALVEAGLHLGFNRAELNNDDEELDFLPFASERRFAAVLVEGVHGHYAILSGAPEYMVAHANYYYGTGGKPSVMTNSDRARLDDLQSLLAGRGHRLTGVARVPIAAHQFAELDTDDILASLGKKLEFLGYLGFTDPVRGDVPKAIQQAQSAGARVVVATGDNRNTALAIAKQAGVVTTEAVIEGRELVDKSDAEIYELFKTTSVFARMRPTQKKRLADILQSYGHVVAMTGDGINDAPALASADVGIAVHSGTDVAKSAADVILLKNSFATIVAAIREGRRLLDNIRRVTVHRISAGFGEIIIVMTALLLAAPVPILPKQILWINIIQGGLLTFAYAFEPAEADVMQRPPNQKGSRGILNNQTKLLLILSSLVFGLVSLCVYLLGHFDIITVTDEQLRTLIFAVLTIDVIVFSFALKDFNKPVWQIKLLSNRFLVLAVLISSVAFIATMLVPTLRDFLSLSAISGHLWLLILGVAVVDIVLIEVAKTVARRNYAPVIS